MFKCLRGTLVVSKALNGFFVSSKVFSHPDGMGFGQKFKYMDQLYFIGRFQGTFCHSINRTSQGTFFNNNRNILVTKCEKHNPPKIVGKFLSGKTRSEYLKQTERLSRNVKPFSTFRNFRQYLFPRTVISQKKSLGAPGKSNFSK